MDQKWMKKFVIFSDSKSMLESIDNQDSSNPLVLDTLQLIYNLHEIGKLIEFCCVPSHVGIRGNEEADRAAKSALDLPVPSDSKVPSSDKLPQIKSYISNIWQEEWNKNNHQKLFEIMPLIGEFNVNFLSRKEQVIIHRLRIGHTRLTHSYRMENRPNAPMCNHCNEELTVKHIMLYCQLYTISRNRFFNVNNMRDPFVTVPPRTIVAYIKDIGLFNCL